MFKTGLYKYSILGTLLLTKGTPCPTSTFSNHQNDKNCAHSYFRLTILQNVTYIQFVYRWQLEIILFYWSTQSRASALYKTSNSDQVTMYWKLYRGTLEPGGNWWRRRNIPHLLLSWTAFTVMKFSTVHKTVRQLCLQAVCSVKLYVMKWSFIHFVWWHKNRAKDPNRFASAPQLMGVNKSSKPGILGYWIWYCASSTPGKYRIVLDTQSRCRIFQYLSSKSNPTKYPTL